MPGKYSEADIQQAPAPAQHGRYSEADVLPEQSFGAAAEEYGRKMNPVAMAQGISQNFYHPIEALKRWGDVNNRLLSNAEDAAKRGDYTEAAAHALHYVLNGIPGLGEALDEAGTKMREGDIAGGLADTAALGTQIVAGAKAPAIAKAIGTAGQYTAAATKTAAPGVLGGMAKAGAGEVLAKLPGMELPARFGLQYPALRQVAKAIEKGHEAGMKAITPEPAAPAVATRAAVPPPARASEAPPAATPPVTPEPEAPTPTAPGKTAADLLNEEMGTKEAAPPITAKAPGQALAESHGETWSKLSQDDKLAYAQLEGAQASAEARNAAQAKAFTPRPPEYYGVKAAEVPPPQPPPSAPAPAQSASAAPSVTSIQPNGGPLRPPVATPAPAAPESGIPFEAVRKTGPQDALEGVGGGVGPGFNVYKVPTEKLIPSEDISGMPEKMADVAKYAEKLKAGSEPPALFGHYDPDTGNVVVTSGSRRLMAAQQANADSLPVAIPKAAPGAEETLAVKPAPEPPAPKPASGAAAAKSQRYADAIAKWAKDMGMTPKAIADQWGTTTPEVRGQIILELKQKGYLGANETIPRTSAQGIIDALKARAATIKPPKGFSLGEMGTTR